MEGFFPNLLVGKPNQNWYEDIYSLYVFHLVNSPTFRYKNTDAFY